LEIDRTIEEITGMDCDEGAKLLSDEEFIRIVEFVLKRRRNF